VPPVTYKASLTTEQTALHLQRDICVPQVQQPMHTLFPMPASAPRPSIIRLSPCGAGAAHPWCAWFRRSPGAAVCCAQPAGQEGCCSGQAGRTLPPAAQQLRGHGKGGFVGGEGVVVGGLRGGGWLVAMVPPLHQFETHASPDLYGESCCINCMTAQP
jgi:hypothetical protein